MTAAKPVVATDCGGNRELVENGVTGFIVPPGSHRALAAALSRLLRNPEGAKEMGRRGRERIEREFTPNMVVAMFEELYRAS